MAINQITVFLENKDGNLSNITKIISENHIDMRAINIAETADYGLLRVIVDDSEKALKILKENGYITTSSPVVAATVSNKPGGLNSMLEVLANEQIGINYMYSIFGTIENNAYMALHVNDVAKTEEILKKNGIKVANTTDLAIK